MYENYYVHSYLQRCKMKHISRIDGIINGGERYGKILLKFNEWKETREKNVNICSKCPNDVDDDDDDDDIIDHYVFQYEWSIILRPCHGKSKAYFRNISFHEY